MTSVSLMDNERAVLESLAAFGPERGLDPTVQGRLALYKLIDETPHGWKITALGREVLTSAQPRQAAREDADIDTEEKLSPTERHYGRKSRNTSWLD
ncbi:MAG: hypothetical protein JSR91_20175 [Proteobacteria bacterium]|nr:hypothetical protein [Pseudomonadota bacterium]